MARRRSAPDADLPENFGEEPPSGTACLPRVVFLLLLGLLVSLLAVEVRNGLRHPSVLRVPGPGGAPSLVFYQKGHASAREAWLLDEPEGSAGPPRLIQRIDCRPQSTTVGEIRWTGDGRALYAAGRTPQSRGVPVLRWLFEFDPGKPGPAAAGAGRLFVSGPDAALPGRPAMVEPPAALTARWRQHRGAGPVAAAWYDLGAMGTHLFSWQATRWENALAQ